MAKGPIALDTTGLKEALADMERADRLDAQKDLKVEFGKIATEAVRYGKAGASTRLEQRAAGTLRNASTGSAASVGFGRGFPGAMGAEFGASQNTRRRRSSGDYLGLNQFKVWSGSGLDAGYFVWPGIRQAAEEGAEDLADAGMKILGGER
jgi:hypothetical protein